MQLALKQSAPANATRWQRLAAQLIRLRLCTTYCHGAVVINGDLYQATAARGVHAIPAGDWEPEKWVLVPFGGPTCDARALQLFASVDGSAYDWWGVMRFVLPALSQRPQAWYCFELASYLKTAERERGLVTPENLFELAARDMDL